MSKIQEELKSLYSEENLSDEEIQSMVGNLKNFLSLCVRISEQEKSPQSVQGNPQKIVQNENYME